MRHEGLFVAISEEEPCGPDLDEQGDGDFLNYTLSVDGRIPERYFDKDGAPFDRSSIDLRAELAAISPLLKRTRDLRLLGIEARFQALSGQIVGFCECVTAMAGLLTRFWPHVHPRDSGGDFMLRQNTVSVLESRPSVLLPLQNATIVRDRRHGSITYRHHAVNIGDATAVPGSANPSASDITEALGNLDNATAVAACHGAVSAALAAIAEIKAVFAAEAGYDFVPDLDNIKDTLGRIADLIETNVPTLAAGGRQAEAGEASLSEAPANDGGATPSPAARTGTTAAARPGAPTDGPVRSQDAAKAALWTAERYFAVHEPSSPALLLVSQARRLIGQPLVTVLQALVSDMVERAAIRIDPENGFQLDMNRMRDLTEGLPSDGGRVVATEVGGFDFKAASRAEAIALLSAVETFLKVAEPSSPVPLLLEKARGFSNQDFRSILKSLLVR